MTGKVFLWMALVLIRIGWSVVPQAGYIHPDEFFQTVEVIAGIISISVPEDCFYLSKHCRPWSRYSLKYEKSSMNASLVIGFRHQIQLERQYANAAWKRQHSMSYVTLFILMDYPIHIDAISKLSMKLSILYFKRLPKLMYFCPGRLFLSYSKQCRP